MMASPWTAVLLCPIPHPHHHALSPLTAPVPALCPGDPTPAHCRAAAPRSSSTLPRHLSPHRAVAALHLGQLDRPEQLLVLVRKDFTFVFKWNIWDCVVCIVLARLILTFAGRMLKQDGEDGRCLQSVQRVSSSQRVSVPSQKTVELEKCLKCQTSFKNTSAENLRAY